MKEETNKKNIRIKKTGYISFLFFVVFLLSCFTILTKVALAQDENYVWVLVNEVDDRGIGKLDEFEARYKKYENSSVDTSLNNTGHFVDYFARKSFVGISSAAQATISTAPLEIKPDTEVLLNVRVSVTENEGYDGAAGDESASAKVAFCGVNSTLEHFLPPIIGGKPFYENEFKSESKESVFNSNSTNAYPVHNTIVSGSVPAGTAHGEVIAVCAGVTLLGVPMGTIYHYRWMPSGSGEVTDINKKYEVFKDENGDYIDSGVRVSDIAGEVYVRRGDGERYEWEMLNLGDVIYEGDMIHTKTRNSHCILSLSDLTVFKMRPRSGIIINTRSEKESALSLLAGKVLVNVKKMIKDGSMNVEMSQAIAGARGTIFVLESDEKNSRVAVLEGQVEVRGKDGGIVILNPNEKIAITEGKAEEREAFALKDELNLWEDETRSKIISDIEERTGQAPDLETVPTIETSDSNLQSVGKTPDEKNTFPYLYLAIIPLIFLVGIGFWLKQRKPN